MSATHGSSAERWAERRVKFAAQINPRVPALPDDLEVSFVPMEAVRELGGLDLTVTRPAGDVRQGYTAFAEGDVVVAKITPCFENGKAAIARGLHNGFAFGTTELHVIRARPDQEPRWLFYLALSDDFRKLGESEMYGAGGQKRVPPSFLANFRAPFPPLDEQRAIADFLDRKTAAIDALIVKKQRLIELLEEKRQALITQAVTKGLDPDVPMKDSGIDWLGPIPAHWHIEQLRRVVSVFVDYRGRTPDKKTDGVPLITAGAIRDGRIDHERAPEFIAEEDYDEWMRRGLPAVDDLVLTTEAPLGEVALVEDTRVAFAQRVILMKLNRAVMSPGFLRLFYLSGSGKGELLSRASGSTASGIRADRLRDSLVVVPPVPEQEAITDAVWPTLGGIDRVASAIRQHIDQLREYRQALITAAVTGKIIVDHVEDGPGGDTRSR